MRAVLQGGLRGCVTAPDRPPRRSVHTYCVLYHSAAAAKAGDGAPARLAAAADAAAAAAAADAAAAAAAPAVAAEEPGEFYIALRSRLRSS